MDLNSVSFFLFGFILHRWTIVKGKAVRVNKLEHRSGRWTSKVYQKRTGLQTKTLCKATFH